MRTKSEEPNVYKFRIEPDGSYVLVAKAYLNLYCIERILGKAKVKGDRKTYELIEIKDYGCPICDGTYLVERKKLTFGVVCHFITTHAYGARSVQHHPYSADLLDDELLDDLGIEVLKYKHFYSSDDFLADCFYPVKKDAVSDELLKQLKEKSEKEVQEAARIRELRNSTKRYAPKWTMV